MPGPFFFVFLFSSFLRTIFPPQGKYWRCPQISSFFSLLPSSCRKGISIREDRPPFPLSLGALFLFSPPDRLQEKNKQDLILSPLFFWCSISFFPLPRRLFSLFPSRARSVKLDDFLLLFLYSPVNREWMGRPSSFLLYVSFFFSRRSPRGPVHLFSPLFLAAGLCDSSPLPLPPFPGLSGFSFTTIRT